MKSLIQICLSITNIIFRGLYKRKNFGKTTSLQTVENKNEIVIKIQSLATV